MKVAPLPPTEDARLRALRQTGVLDTEPEESFDYLTAMAAEICGTPIALITLVDVDRQWFKSSVGVEIAETPRDVSFCAHTILQSDLLVVGDALKDDRFADNPLVTADPRIRFYAGSPLVTHDGHAIGTFCVIDTVPRRLSEQQATALRALSRHAAAVLGLRRTRELLREHAEQWERSAGDPVARSAALERLDEDLTSMIRDRERAETTLRRLQPELRVLGLDLRGSVGLEDLLESIVGHAEQLCAALPLDHPRRPHADSIVHAARRARALLASDDRED